MPTSNPFFEKLSTHSGHQIELVAYGGRANPVNLAIECRDCHEVLVSADRDPTDADVRAQIDEWLKAQQRHAWDEGLYDHLHLGLATERELKELRTLARIVTTFYQKGADDDGWQMLWQALFGAGLLVQENFNSDPPLDQHPPAIIA